jgi:hypothetical protein
MQIDASEWEDGRGNRVMIENKQLIYRGMYPRRNRGTRGAHYNHLGTTSVGYLACNSLILKATSIISTVPAPGSQATERNHKEAEGRSR